MYVELSDHFTHFFPSFLATRRNILMNNQTCQIKIGCICATCIIFHENESPECLNIDTECAARLILSTGE